MPGGCHLRAFGPCHERVRRHRRRAPAPRPRERSEVRRAQPPQHLLLKEVGGQPAEHGAEQQRRGRRRVAQRRGRHRILGGGVTGCCGGGSCGGGGGGGGSRWARRNLCQWARCPLVAFCCLLGNPPAFYTRAVGGLQFLPREGAGRSSFPWSPRPSSDLEGERRGVREGGGGGGGAGGGGGGSRGARENLCGLSSWLCSFAVQLKPTRAPRYRAEGSGCIYGIGTHFRPLRRAARHAADPRAVPPY